MLPGKQTTDQIFAYNSIHRNRCIPVLTRDYQCAQYIGCNNWVPDPNHAHVAGLSGDCNLPLARCFLQCYTKHAELETDQSDLRCSLIVLRMTVFCGSLILTEDLPYIQNRLISWYTWSKLRGYFGENRWYSRKDQ